MLPPHVRFLRLQCTKFDFGWGSAPDPDGGAFSTPPDSLAGFKGPTSKGMGREGEWRGEGSGEGREEEVRGEGREGEGRMDSNTGPSLGAPTQLRHCVGYIRVFMFIFCCGRL